MTTLSDFERARRMAGLTLAGLAALVAINGQSSAAQLPDGAGKATMQRVCSGCHAPEIVIGRHETKEGWVQIVSSMVDKGANGTDDEFNTIIDYLAANFTKAETPGRPDGKSGANPR